MEMDDRHFQKNDEIMNGFDKNKKPGQETIDFLTNQFLFEVNFPNRSKMEIKTKISSG